MCLKGSVVDPDPELFGSGIMVLNQDTDPDLIFLTCIFFPIFSLKWSNSSLNIVNLYFLNML